MKAIDYVDIFTSSGLFLKPSPYQNIENTMGSTTGRWNTPNKNKESFMASSPGASCCTLSTGNKEWGNQDDDDITTLVERLEKHRKVFTPNIVQSTVSSPPTMWGNSCSTSTNSHQHWASNNSAYKSQSFNRSGHTSFLMGGQNSFTSSSKSMFGSRTQQCSKDSFIKPHGFSISYNYENDRLMAMD